MLLCGVIHQFQLQRSARSVGNGLNLMMEPQRNGHSESAPDELKRGISLVHILEKVPCQGQCLNTEQGPVLVRLGQKTQRLRKVRESRRSSEVDPLVYRVHLAECEYEKKFCILQAALPISWIWQTTVCLEQKFIEFLFRLGKGKDGPNKAILSSKKAPRDVHRR